MNQVPRVVKGQMLKKGDLIADGASTDRGMIGARAKECRGAVPFRGRGYNFEDAIIMSDGCLQRIVTALSISDFSLDVRDTKLRSPVVTRDIPNIGEDRLKIWMNKALFRIVAGFPRAIFWWGRFLRKGEGDLTAEERLLRVIFGEEIT